MRRAPQPSVNRRSDRNRSSGLRGGVACSARFSASSGCSAAASAARPIGTAAPDKVADPKARQARAERPDAADGAVQSLKRELALLHDAIAHNKRELAALIGDGHERRMAHAAGKLGAAVEGMEKATVKILKSTEVIDDSARALTATLRDDYKRGLAQEIQDHVVKIYEACNFQDLSGQRIGHVIETLNMIEDQVAGMLDAPQRPAGRCARRRAVLRPRTTQRSPARRRFRPHQPERHRRDVRASADALNRVGRRIRIKQTSAVAAKPAASASAAGSEARSTTKAITSGAAACTSRNGPASRPIRRAITRRAEQRQRYRPARDGDQAVGAAEH